MPDSTPQPVTPTPMPSIVTPPTPTIMTSPNVAPAPVAPSAQPVAPATIAAQPNIPLITPQPTIISASTDVIGTGGNI